MGDPIQIQQVLDQTLVINAMDAVEGLPDPPQSRFGKN